MLEGIHPTTASCLEVLQTLPSRLLEVSDVLDIGCGGGVLSVMAAHLWPEACVLAADISAAAVNDTRALARSQGLSERLSVVQSDGFSHPVIAQHAPYALIICNLLAEPLVAMAPTMHASLMPGGHALISGILMWLLEPVEHAYREVGMSVQVRSYREPWVTLLLTAPCQPT